MFSSILSQAQGYVLESIADIIGNPVSVIIFSGIAILIILLLLATFSKMMRASLVFIKVLEPDEEPVSLLKWIITVIIIVKLVQTFFIQPFIVSGLSMYPTYDDKQFLLVDKLSYRLHNAERGDVMIFKLYEGNSNPFEGKHLIKRVIGLPGERITVNDGVTTIYNKAHPEGFTIDESFVTYKEPRKNVDITLDDHHYFVMGDNRAQSYDSRDWGALDAKDVKGRVLVRIFPFYSFSYEPGRVHYDK